MDLILETNRLILKPLNASHAQNFFEMDSNPNVHKYLWNKPVEKIEKSVANIESVIKQYETNGIGRFAMHLKENNDFVGWCGLKFNTELVNNKTNFYDIGYRLNEKYWGQGYATEASLPWITYGFKEMEIKKIEAAAHKDNMASNKILEKIGLTFTDTYLEDEIVWNWYEMNAAEYYNTKP